IPVVGGVYYFTYVAVMIVELSTTLTVIPFNVPPALGAHRVARERASLDLSKCRTLPRLSALVEQGLQANTLEILGRGQTGQVRESRVQIDKFHGTRAYAAVSLGC